MIKIQKRDLYLKKLIALRDQPVIKVITGMRRSGKSSLLILFADYLKEQGVAEENIVHMNFESMLFDELDDYRKLYQYIREKIKGKNHVYLLLDEIQQVRSWERAVNSLLVDAPVDIYITGSNAGLLSSELATLLVGRYAEIRVFPLSFREYLDFLAKGRDVDLESAFQSYLRYGGLPLIPSLPQDDEAVQIFLSGIYNTVIMKDVVQRNSVRDPVLLDGLVRFLADNIGNPVSSKKISDYLNSAGRKTSSLTIDNYIAMLESAFIFHRARRYDIKGKLYLKTQEKFYIADTGLRNILLGFRGGDYGHLLENAVYLELLRRGYEVSVGRAGKLEVDFAAVRPDHKVYYQVAASVLDDNVRERELRPFGDIRDAYEKVLLSMDRTFITDFNGVRNRNIIDFLLEDGAVS